MPRKMIPTLQMRNANDGWRTFILIDVRPAQSETYINYCDSIVTNNVWNKCIVELETREVDDSCWLTDERVDEFIDAANRYGHESNSLHCIARVIWRSAQCQQQLLLTSTAYCECAIPSMLLITWCHSFRKQLTQPNPQIASQMAFLYIIK